MKEKYEKHVFINCPFDPKYLKLRNALIFAIFDCGFIPRCALEEDNSGDVRIEKIIELIRDSKFGFHDISRTELDEDSKLPRFNMPLELGVFLGAKNFGTKIQKGKNCLILDSKPHRYQAFISDIAGHDIKSHNSNVKELIKHVRNWLSNASDNIIIFGGTEINRRFEDFEKLLPQMCDNAKIEMKELTYNDYNQLISNWLSRGK